MIGNDAFQEADFVGITRPCTKHNYLVKDVKRPRPHHQGGLLHREHRPARPGGDRSAQGRAAGASTPFKYPDQVDIRGYKPTIKGNPRQIERAIEAIEKSEKPLFYVGGGVQWSGAAPELTQLVRGLGIPVTRDPDGPGVVSGLRSAMPRDARDARLVRHQHGGVQHRLPDRGRRALRRPRHRTHRRLRAQGQDHHPYRYRSVVDFQERQGRRSDRRRYQVGAGRHAGGGARARESSASAARRGRNGISRFSSGSARSRCTRTATAAPGRHRSRRIHVHRGDAHADQGRLHRRHRRRPASDVGRAALSRSSGRARC